VEYGRLGAGGGGGTSARSGSLEDLLLYVIDG
jgi:hypothetical protein